MEKKNGISRGHNRTSHQKGIPTIQKTCQRKENSENSVLGPILILENGAHTMKIGFSTDEKPRIIPNCISKVKSEKRRPFIADQVEECRDTSGLFYILPFEKGYMVKGDLEKTIWDYVFNKQCMNVEPAETNLIVTEPYMNFRSLQDSMCELIFEEYEFKSVHRTTAAHLADFNYTSNSSQNSLLTKSVGVTPLIENSGEKDSGACTLLVDSGFSFTHVIPIINGTIGRSHMRRIDVGGKALTNYLKEIVSYRQIHVMDETYLINQVKEDTCFVSQDFLGDMKTARKKPAENPLYMEYILPDYTSIRRGSIRPRELLGTRPADNTQFLRLNNERFSVPEILFRPSNVGIQQSGIPETIVQVVSSYPPSVQYQMYNNIVLFGGCTKFPGFQDRVLTDVRSNCSELFNVQVSAPKCPTTYPWDGGKLLSRDSDLERLLVTKKEYDESGITAFQFRADI